MIAYSVIMRNIGRATPIPQEIESWSGLWAGIPMGWGSQTAPTRTLGAFDAAPKRYDFVLAVGVSIPKRPFILGFDLFTLLVLLSL